MGSANPPKTINAPVSVGTIAPDEWTGWSDASKMAIKEMKKKYGEPAEKTSEMMIWNNTGQWKKG
jgi:hypothetical protein